jgi:MFS family permease
VRRLLLLVGAIVFVDSMFFAALTPLLPHYADTLDLSKAEAGVLTGAFAAGALAGGIPGGMTAARLGVRPTVLLGLAGIAVTTVTFGFTDVYWVLVAARFLQGCSSSFSWTSSLAWLVAAAPPARRGELIGAAMGAAIFGALFGPVLGGIASATSIELAFSSVAVLAGGLAVWAARTPASAPGRAQPLGLLFQALRDPGVASGAWLVALPALFFGTLGVLAPLRLDELGWGATAIGATWLVMAALEGSLAPIVGRFSDRRGRLAPLRACLAGSIVVAATLPWLSNAWLLAVFVVLSGVTFGTFWVPAMSLLADSAEAVGLEHAYTFTIVNTAWAPGAALGAVFGGAMAEATSDAVPYLLLAAACVVSLAALTRVVGARQPLPANR